MVIYKYQLTAQANILAMPSDSEPIYVDEQRGETTMWVIHHRDPDNTRVYNRYFYVFNTGEAWNIGHVKHIGSFQTQSGLVKHVFEQLDVS